MAHRELQPSLPFSNVTETSRPFAVPWDPFGHQMKLYIFQYRPQVKKFVRRKPSKKPAEDWAALGSGTQSSASEQTERGQSFVRRIDRYILKQLLTPFMFALIVLTAIVWLTQSLQRLDIIVEHGEGWRTFGWLTLLLIPNLLSVIVPFAIFGATLFALHHLHADSEIAVIFAAGISRARIAAPVMLIAFVTAAATMWINLDLMPRSYRMLKQEIADIRADFASAVIKTGEFTTFADGFTIYVEEALNDNQFRGLLISDYRNGDSEETYMAQYGKLQETDTGPVLLLSNGNIQTVSPETEEIDIVAFENTAVNVSGFSSQGGSLQLELTERYLGELLHPDMTNQWDRENSGRLIAEGHQRLASPLYPVAYALIAVYALIGGPYNRRGYSVRIVAACAVVGGIRIMGFVAQNTAAESGIFQVVYLVPAVPIIVTVLLLSDLIRLPRIGASLPTFAKVRS